jgi:hypothetical protein
MTNDEKVIDLTQRWRDDEESAWDEVLAEMTDLLGLCPQCNTIGYVAPCTTCAQLMCGACFGGHEYHCRYTHLPKES